MRSCRRLLRIALVVSASACTLHDSAGESELYGGEARALRDTILTLADSLIAIHQARPDTALHARIFPLQDSLLYVEGQDIRTITGEALLLRTVNAHATVRSMSPKAIDRHVEVFGRNAAELTVRWVVDVVDTTGMHHPWEGPLTMGVIRRGNRWVVRSYRE